ncbi:hypothetical protein CSAL01_05212 [Colletotrichum salicis]|uniref:Uncharacterized protein n=1 Tax=Colletotrichum salicis TaxID=1209931 RepID=A0A135ULU3_9PEZI|nr:hypothetical protein CSAL01_05212 [Colletotrichum salicis]
MSAPYYTPQRPYFPPSNHPSASSSTSASRPGGTASGATPSFTPAMRDRQARGKDPYSPHDSPSDSDLEFDGPGGGSPSRSGVGRLGHLGLHHGGGGGGGGGGMLAGGGGGGIGDGDSHEVRRRKLWAVAVLEDPEKLAMYACSRGDLWLIQHPFSQSIPGTRLHFTRMLCGFDEEPTLQQQQQSDHRKASSSSARRDPRRRSAGGDRMGRH